MLTSTYNHLIISLDKDETLPARASYPQEYLEYIQGDLDRGRGATQPYLTVEEHVPRNITNAINHLVYISRSSV